MKATPYVSYNGNCEEAVQFYQSVLGGEMRVVRFSELPAEEGIPVSEGYKDKIMHCALSFDDGNAMYFGDTWENAEVTIGTNTTIHLNVDSESRVHEIVEKLSVKGEITMPAEKTFWGSVYGSLVDRYGVSWGVEFALEG